jgi:hypothetical protein
MCREGLRMPEIHLPSGSKWTYNELDMLGPPGGFGAVFRGHGADSRVVAVKRLKSDYQSREMRIADYLLGHGLAHVIPIFDAGFDVAAATNFIVMPVADVSLQQQISASAHSARSKRWRYSGQLPPAWTKSATSSIAISNLGISCCMRASGSWPISVWRALPRRRRR